MLSDAHRAVHLSTMPPRELPILQNGWHFWIGSAVTTKLCVCASMSFWPQRLEHSKCRSNNETDVLNRNTAPDVEERTEPQQAEPEPGSAEGASGPTASYKSAEVPTLPVIGSVIAGRYKLRQEIGEGGMGSVYLAEQTQPVKRQVALKLIKAGHGLEGRARPLRTRAASPCVMDHPNIAKVLDAGSTEAGRPFFVMERSREFRSPILRPACVSLPSD